MSGRAVLSRPRTRIYDANYNIGQNYYKSALDRLDQKYSPRPLSPLRSSLAKDIIERHEQAFADEDLLTSRRRAEKHITQNNLFDSRGARISRALDLMENDIDEETASALVRVRANKKISVVNNADFENTVNNINSHRLLDRSEKLLGSVGINEHSRKALDEDVTIKKRSLKVTYEGDSGDLVKWSPLKLTEERESAAAIRAKQTKDRLIDLEDEMAALAEKQVARERRAARLKALVAENTEQSDEAHTAVKMINFKSRREQRTLEE